MSYVPPEPPVSYLFVDGECLNHTLSKLGERYFGGVKPPLNWLHVRGQHRKAFYYDAIPVQTRGEDDNTYYARIGPKRAELGAIERQDAYHVRTGDARRRQNRGNEQKMVDVQLAVDALLMASRGLFVSFTLVTGDLDFKPLISALVDMGVDVQLLYPPGETNEELLAAADRAYPLTIDRCRHWISEKFPLKTMLPTATFVQNGGRSEPRRRMVTWRHDPYGTCYVAVRDDAVIELVTEYEPNNPSMHRLEITASTLTLLRNYAEDIFSLIVPPWEDG